MVIYFFCDHASVFNVENSNCAPYALVYLCIQSVVEGCSLQEDTKGCVNIMIDDLSCLEIAAHGSMDDVLDSLHYCVNLTSEMDCSLVILNHEEMYATEENHGLLTHLRSFQTFWLFVLGLESQALLKESNKSPEPDLADLSFFSLAAHTGTDLSPQGPVPESNTCAQTLSAAHNAYGNRSLILGTGPREQKSAKCRFSPVCSPRPAPMHFLGF
uniref:Elongator complex protein 6 n=1 Tax=Ananas comosus var. bracteatus TaxID=296719 RepID=A0A6V7P214_ANACO|nr:unnamed protein product [Ananas comosus var. bracteatus]